jgi:hypothetical protein
MKKGGGRAKGSAFERHVAKMVITAFAHHGIKKVDCYRTPLSGGHRFARESDPGDLVFSPKLANLFPASVECKSYRTLDWPKLFLSGKKGHWGDWWNQCVAASSPGRHPLLVFRQNRSEVFCMYQPEDWWNWTPLPVFKGFMHGRQIRIIRFSVFLEKCVERNRK